MGLCLLYELGGEMPSLHFGSTPGVSAPGQWTQISQSEAADAGTADHFARP